MIEFGLALAIFMVSHAIPTRPAIRERLIAAFGKPAYLAGYSLMSIGLLAWLISAAWRAPHVAVWDPQSWQAGLAIVLVPLGLFLIVAGAISPNPLSVTFVSSGYDPKRPGIVGITRHPVLWGLALWGVAHTVANGDAVGLILFGTQTGFAIVGTWLVDRRTRRQLGDARWNELAASTSNLPLAAMFSGRSRYIPDRRQAYALILAGATTLILLGAEWHSWLFGMDPLAWWS